MNYKFIEELSLNHWQSLSTLFYDGWALRFAQGYTKRANSISPIHYSTIDLQTKITECEKLYTHNNLPTIFKITPFIHPSSLDEALSLKGYEKIDLSIIKIMNLANLPEAKLNTVKIEREPSTQWINQFLKLNQISEDKRSTITQMLSNIKSPVGYISFYFENQVVACGFGVIERGYMGLYDIVTDTNYRNRGFAEQMILNLLHWGKEHGATDSYLAVIAENTAALKLYSKLGYKEIYRYWYRIKHLQS